MQCTQTHTRSHYKGNSTITSHTLTESRCWHTHAQMDTEPHTRVLISLQNNTLLMVTLNMSHIEIWNKMLNKQKIKMCPAGSNLLIDQSTTCSGLNSPRVLFPISLFRYFSSWSTTYLQILYARKKSFNRYSERMLLVWVDKGFVLVWFIITSLH